MQEVAQHRTQDDAWLVYNGKVWCLKLYLRACSGQCFAGVACARAGASSLDVAFWVEKTFLSKRRMDDHGSVHM